MEELRMTSSGTVKSLAIFPKFSIFGGNQSIRLLPYSPLLSEFRLVLLSTGESESLPLEEMRFYLRFTRG
jgi:hypothetical protein